ncbi:hypothetical protein [Mesorhizobium qingshengii]|uniref:hypothetical protein n=1 Tax=Mesorhizobium qingshengii TaxID=1165689 RepID=UPI003B3BD4E4
MARLKAMSLFVATVEAGTREFEPEPWPVNLVHTGQGRLPVKLRAFLDFAAPRLWERLAQASWWNEPYRPVSFLPALGVTNAHLLTGPPPCSMSDRWRSISSSTSI